MLFFSESSVCLWPILPNCSWKEPLQHQSMPYDKPRSYNEVVHSQFSTPSRVYMTQLSPAGRPFHQIELYTNQRKYASNDLLVGQWNKFLELQHDATLLPHPCKIIISLLCTSSSSKTFSLGGQPLTSPANSSSSVLNCGAKLKTYPFVHAPINLESNFTNWHISYTLSPLYHRFEICAV